MKGKIAAVQKAGPKRAAEETPVSLGLAQLDAALPGGGLATDDLHEVAARGHGDLPCALGFLTALVARLMAVRAAPVVWCTRGPGTLDFGTLYGPGLGAMGCDPGRLLVVEARAAGELLWAVEQAGHVAGLAAVVGEIGPAAVYDLTASRRLLLGARASGVPVLLLRGAGAAAAGTSAAATRWRVAAAPGGQPHVGVPVWRVALERARHMPGSDFLLGWDRDACRFVAPAQAPLRGRERPRRTGAEAGGEALRAVRSGDAHAAAG